MGLKGYQSLWVMGGDSRHQRRGDREPSLRYRQIISVLWNKIIIIMTQFQIPVQRSFSCSNYSHRFHSDNYNPKTITIPMPQPNFRGESPEEIEMSLIVHLKQPNNNQHDPRTQDSYIHQPNLKSSRKSLISKNNLENNLVQCSICMENVESEEVQSHYIQHKLCGSTNKKLTTSRYPSPKAKEKYSSNHKDLSNQIESSTNSKYYSKSNFNTITKLADLDPYQKISYPVLKTTDLPLDELIEGIKLSHIKRQSIYRTNSSFQQILQNSISNAESRNSQIEYNFDRKSSRKTLLNNPEQAIPPQDASIPPHPSLNSMRKKATVQSVPADSRALPKKKLSLFKDIVTQSQQLANPFASRLRVSDSQGSEWNKHYKFQRDNSRKKMISSCTKPKVPLNIFAQQDILVSKRVY